MLLVVDTFELMMDENNKVLQSAKKYIFNSILFQFGFRIATFLINAIIIRFISKEIIGIVHVRLALLYSTIYCLTSEPFVRACCSRLDLNDHKNKGRLDVRSSMNQTINLLWLSLPVGLLWIVICCTVWLAYIDWPSSSITSSYQIAVLCYALAAFIEILSEPIRIIMQILLLSEVKPIIEGLSLVIENVVLIFSIYYFPSLGLLSFCISKICCTVSVTTSYYVYILYKIKNNNNKNNHRNDDDGNVSDSNHDCKHTTKRITETSSADDDVVGGDDDDSKKKLSPHILNNDFPFTSFKQLLPKKLSSIDEKYRKEKLELLWSFSNQVFLKQGFTEGEKYIMTVFGVLSFADQGVYSIVNNLSSMVVRMLFLPMEEGFYLFLSQTLLRTSSAKSQNKDSLKLVAKSLEAMLKVRLLLGITVATFGFTCSYLALDIVFGERLSSPPGPSLLKWNCLYIFLVSINGITEGFHNASTDKKHVNKYNKMMLIFSMAFLVTSWFFTNYFALGAIGFYLSNCCNMLLRILYSLVYMHGYFEGTPYQPIRALLPSIPVILSYLISFFITFISEVCLCHSASVSVLPGYLFHLLIVTLSLVSTLFVIYKTERSLVTFLREEYFSKDFNLKIPTNSLVKRIKNYFSYRKLKSG